MAECQPKVARPYDVFASGTTPSTLRLRDVFPKFDSDDESHATVQRDTNRIVKRIVIIIFQAMLGIGFGGLLVRTYIAPSADGDQRPVLSSSLQPAARLDVATGERLISEYERWSSVDECMMNATAGVVTRIVC